MLRSALHNYHDTHKELPAAAWLRPQTSPTDNILIDNRLFWNWVIRILPYLEEQSLLAQFTINVTTPISKDTGTNNKQARGTEVPVMLCPSDVGRSNPFQGTSGNWARGNYGYNAFQFWPNEYWRLLSTDSQYAPWFKLNLGMGGIEDGVDRQVLSLAKITDGNNEDRNVGRAAGWRERERSTRRLGDGYVRVKPALPARGVCAESLHSLYRLCSGVIDFHSRNWRSESERNVHDAADRLGYEWSDARTKHSSGGANCAMADASVRFISDFIDSGTLITNEDGYIDLKPGDQTTATALGTWQRLNLSRDGYAIDKEY